MRDSINETKKAQNKSKKRVNTKEMLVKNKKNTKKLVLKVGFVLIRNYICCIFRVLEQKWLTNQNAPK